MRDQPPLNGAAPYSSNGYLQVSPPSHVARCYVNVQRLPSPPIVASVFNHYSPSPLSAQHRKRPLEQQLVHDGKRPAVHAGMSRREASGAGGAVVRVRTTKPVIYREMHHEVEHAATLCRAHSCHDNTKQDSHQGASFLQRRATFDGYPQKASQVVSRAVRRLVSVVLSVWRQCFPGIVYVDFHPSCGWVKSVLDG